MNSTTVRRATPLDIAHVAQVFIEARTQCLPFLNWQYELDIVEAVFHRRLTDTEMFVAEIEGQVVGFITVLPGEIEDLYLHPDYHRRGIGSALLQEGLSRAGAPTRLWVFQENRAARAFYESHGFLLEFETDGSANMEKVPDARYVRPG